jgi:hypothetical protein
MFVPTFHSALLRARLPSSLTRLSLSHPIHTEIKECQCRPVCLAEMANALPSDLVIVCLKPSATEVEVDELVCLHLREVSASLVADAVAA